MQSPKRGRLHRNFRETAMSHTRAVRRSLAFGSTLTVLAALSAATATSASASAGATANWVPTATLATSIQGATLAGDASPATRVRLILFE